MYTASAGRCILEGDENYWAPRCKGSGTGNTLASIRKAIEHGVDEIEFDVRVTADAEVVLVHDPFLHDPAGNAVLVRTHPLKTLRAHKPDLTTLEDVFVQLPVNTPLVIEIKPREDPLPIIAALKQAAARGWDLSRLHVASFDQKVLLSVHKNCPDAGIVINEKWSGVRASLRARQLKAKRITMRSWWLWPGFISTMHNSGYQLSAYTMNDPVKARRWAKHGLYGVVTDYPDLFV